jgi:head-tail adaptor
LQLPGKIDIYTKTITHNDAGQSVNRWDLKETVSCDWSPARAEERLVGRVQNPVSYIIRVSGHEDVKESYQLQNLRDGNGDVVEDGPFNIIGVRKYRGFRTIDHISINAQKILE